MKKILAFCIAVVLFSFGIIVGAELNSIGVEKKLVEEKNKLDSMQDIVIEKVQLDKEKLHDNEEKVVQEVVSSEIKISPYAVLKIEKYYKDCAHTTIDSIEIPKELVNMTKDELQKKYEKWEIKKFEKDEIYLYREIDANCSSHFVVKEDSGKVAVFAQITDKNMQLKETTNIDFETLREEDKLLISEGVELYGEEELSSFIEDFES
ncbi:MAG: hypothetical protein J6C46_01425 [Clostridia bacterium]|nr:hypothetical protein [Clostridia bacterium]